MNNVRSSISKDLISSLAGDAQRRAYEHVENNSNRQAMFFQKVKDLQNEYDDKVVRSVQKQLVDFVFHARSNVEWKKYKRENTERPARKRKWVVVKS